MNLSQQELEAGEVTKWKSWGLSEQEPAAAAWSGGTEPSPRNPESVGEGEEEGREGKGTEEERDEEKNLEEDLKREETAGHGAVRPRKRALSKSLMDTLWAKFKLCDSLTIQDVLLLSFQFSMTDLQIIEWLSQKREKYKKEMSKQKQSKRRKKRRPIPRRSDKRF